MLRQILETMYVDPEILELMTEDQRQLLFRKMREEQLRRWSAQEKETEKINKTKTKRTPRKIQFLVGRDGQPWTWVMGEHTNDLQYDTLVRQRERREREREEEEEREIRREAEEMAEKETGHILSLASRFGELRSPANKRRSLDSGQPVKSKMAVRRLVSDSGVASFGRMSLTGPLLSVPESPSSLSSSVPRTESQLDLTASGETIETEATDGGTPAAPRGRKESSEDLRRATRTRKVPIIGKTREEQRQFQERRAKEIYHNIQEVKQLAKRRSIEVARGVEERWKESEEKAKAFERTRKASFNKARQLSKKLPKIDETQILEGIPEETKKELEQKIYRNKPTRRPLRPAPAARQLVRRSSVIQPGTRPKTESHVVMWFRESEAPRGVCRERDGSISLWFHGRLSREAAAELLEERAVGSYLVRLSNKRWGYTISVKTYTDVKHFVVDVSSGQYQFVGPKQRQFHSLQQLMTFYRANPITTVGQEVLLVPVAQLETEGSENFRDLFREEDPDTEEVTSTYL